MSKLVIGMVALAFVWSVRAQAAEVTWQKDIRPIFEKQCAVCHGKESPEYGEFRKAKNLWTEKSIGMKMDTYNHLIAFVGWPDAGALMRRLDDGSSKADKKAGNMYEHLGANDVERKANLAIFKAWVGSWNLKRWNDITKEELNAIKVTY